MRSGLVIGILLAVFLHIGIVLFGGLVFKKKEKDFGTTQKVELLSDEDVRQEKEKKKEEEPQPQEEQIEAEQEEVPDAQEVIKQMESSAVANTPRLDAASLGAIEAALGGAAGDAGDFGGLADLRGGGKIGGTGTPGMLGGDGNDPFDMSEIDQKPRAMFQSPPNYPSSMRAVEGIVTVIFVVDENGKVVKPRVEKSSHPEFEKPALNAVKQWKFEAAVKGGKRVQCNMRVPIRFQPR